MYKEIRNSTERKHDARAPQGSFVSHISPPIESQLL
ncbi:hypothetical protein EGR_10385 [Echinococcus granulosus]|uniref:Uncharacterized protein n=1 Tax=Echinococcus granulosus TaxID=6210 RepID=W6U0V2_ECHGR|nr:hypothetical protein EGR_10385 [Echinococcus granulosus]EUB54745.1 hypothetical protein EGR_10385 [Echinococcus granulosus]